MSLSQKEFLRRYHYYRTKSEEEARAEADKVNKEGIENDKAVAINFGDLGWALMLESAATFALNSELIPPQEIK